MYIYIYIYIYIYVGRTFASVAERICRSDFRDTCSRCRSDVVTGAAHARIHCQCHELKPLTVYSMMRHGTVTIVALRGRVLMGRVKVGSVGTLGVPKM